MNNSAEYVVKVGSLARKVEEASAQGFRTPAAMQVLYALQDAVDDLLKAATAEYLAQEVKA